ncbi:MAG: hypothetical protein RBS91_05945 [Sulfurimonadaceae bacterium]|jgi:hypothetical protein|nr:hypothetical protein [Sulfurimonadaceae bacterium]
MIQLVISKENLDKFYKYIESYVNQSDTKYSMDDLNCDLLMLFDKTFEEVVKSTPSNMRELISKKVIGFPNSVLILKDLYITFRNKWAVELLEALDLKVCPFCNREYIFRFEDTVKKEARVIASLDHYYDKNNYPYLAVSIYNLIPSCTICNSKFKHSKNFYHEKHLHPYEDDFNKKVKFSYVLKPIDKKVPIFSKERININLKKLETNIKIDNTIKTFRLQELYNEHKDIVLELIQKSQIYNETYIDELFERYSGTLFSTREELMRLITCGYISDEDINKRPLSKLIKDISEDLGLL